MVFASFGSNINPTKFQLDTSAGYQSTEAVHRCTGQLPGDPVLRSTAYLLIDFFAVSCDKWPTNLKNIYIYCYPPVPKMVKIKHWYVYVPHRSVGTPWFEFL